MFVNNCYFALGRFFDAPLIGTVSSPLMLDWVNSYIGNPINVAVESTIFGQRVPPMNFLERFLNLFQTISIIFSAHHNLKHQNNYVEKYFGPGYPDVFELQRDLSLVFLNYHHAIFGVRPLTLSVVPIAGVHIRDHDDPFPEVNNWINYWIKKYIQFFFNLFQSVKKWLDESTAGCVYFTFGSMVRIETFPKDMVDAMMQSFKSIAPVRVLMKVVHLKDLPTELPENVMTQSWLNQIQVLSKL